MGKSGLPRAAHLTQDRKARLVRGQRQHDEVSIQTVQAVPQIGLPVGPAPLLPYVAHDLVLALPWHIGIRQYHLWMQCRSYPVCTPACQPKSAHVTAEVA